MTGGEASEADGANRFDHRQLDRLVHSRIRLSVLSILAAVEDAEFTYLRDQVNTTDGNLSTHMKKLEDAGYVAVEKRFRDRKPQTRYRLTPRGRDAFREYVDRLERIVASGAPDAELPSADASGGGG